MLYKEDAYFTPSEDIRPLHIWLPDDYEETDERYPVMYMFDGHNLFEDSSATYGTCWGLKDFFEQWSKPMICVGIECSHRGQERLKEYCPYHIQDPYFGDLDGIGKETLHWMAYSLKPYIDQKFRTYSFREATGIGGSSMGGLMSLYGIIHYNQVFSKAACLSSTVTPCPNLILNDIQKTTMDPDTRIYVSWGEKESKWSAEKFGDHFDQYTAHCNQNICKAFRAKGVTVRLYCQPKGSHCEADWSKQVPYFMDLLWRDEQS